MNKKIKPELLAPAGDMDSLHAAISFGADAVYLAGKKFGMRSAPNNFTQEELEEAVNFAHSNNVKVYLTCNSVLRNEEIEELPEFLENVQKIGIDALIISDLGVMAMARKYAPDTAIHISTQAGVANYMTANVLREKGASRVVLARELSFDEITALHDNVPDDLEIETFVHGSMCVSFSGRCLLSNYMTSRDSNRGDCSQPCRWKYALMEEKRPGEYFPIFEDNYGAHILNSRDMCMISYIPQLIRAGVTSFKIEGRAKSPYYVAVVTNAYRAAIDEFFESENEEYKPSQWIIDELEKVSHREYSTGFYLGNEPGQVYDNGGYVREYEVAAMVEECRDGFIYAEQRNKIFRGDMLDALPPKGRAVAVKAEHLSDIDGNEIESTPHPMMKYRIKSELVLPKGTYLRKKK